MASIALVEDHALLADTLRTALHQRGHDVRVLTPGPDLPDALCDLDDVDLVLLDHELGDGLPTGAELAGDLVQAEVTVVMLTGVTEPVALGRCLLAGALGIIHKRDSFDHLVDQIGDALDGHSIAPSPAQRHELIAQAEAANAAAEATNRRLALLSPREREVLAALVRGQTVADIAEASFVAVSTVRSQVKALRQKLGVRNQAQAVAVAAEEGWFSH